MRVCIDNLVWSHGFPPFYSFTVGQNAAPALAALQRAAPRRTALLHSQSPSGLPEPAARIVLPLPAGLRASLCLRPPRYGGQRRPGPPLSPGRSPLGHTSRRGGPARRSGAGLLAPSPLPPAR